MKKYIKVSTQILAIVMSLSTNTYASTLGEVGVETISPEASLVTITGDSASALYELLEARPNGQNEKNGSGISCRESASGTVCSAFVNSRGEFEANPIRSLNRF